MHSDPGGCALIEFESCITFVLTITMHVHNDSFTASLSNPILMAGYWRLLLVQMHNL